MTWKFHTKLSTKKFLRRFTNKRNTLYQVKSVNRLTVAAKRVRNEGVTYWKNVVCDPPQGLECVECAQHLCPRKARSMKPPKVNNFHTDIWPPSAFTWSNSCSHTLNVLSVLTEIVRWISIYILKETCSVICRVEISQGLRIPQRCSHITLCRSVTTSRQFKDLQWPFNYEGEKILRVIGICKTTRYLPDYLYFNPLEIKLLLSSLSSSSSSPVCRVFTITYLQQPCF